VLCKAAAVAWQKCQSCLLQAWLSASDWVGAIVRASGRTPRFVAAFAEGCRSLDLKSHGNLCCFCHIPNFLEHGLIDEGAPSLL
jgi:hypothetical protein